MKRTFLLTGLLVAFAIQASALEHELTASAPTGYLWSGSVALHNGVRLTGIHYDANGLTLRAGHRIQSGLPTPLRLVLTQVSAATRDARFRRRIEFSHTDIDFSGRFAYIYHHRLTAEQSRDLRLIGEDIVAGDGLWLYVYQQQVPARPIATCEREVLNTEVPPPDTGRTVHSIDFTLGWNPTADHAYVWETRDYGDTASGALYTDDGREVEINRIACDAAEAIRFISYDGQLREVLPQTYALKIRKVWHTTGGWRHLRVLTDATAVRVERFGAGSVVRVPKSVGSWTPEPASPTRARHYQTIEDICANTVGTNGNAYLQLVVTETAPAAPRTPYLRKLTGTWGALKKRK